MHSQSRSSLVTRLATNLLLGYARYVPYHRGKTRLSSYLRGVIGVELRGE